MTEFEQKVSDLDRIFKATDPDQEYVIKIWETEVDRDEGESGLADSGTELMELIEDAINLYDTHSAVEVSTYDETICLFHMSRDASDKTGDLATDLQGL